MQSKILLLVIYTIKETRSRLCTRTRRKIKTGLSDCQMDFHRFNFTGNAAAKHLKVAYGTKFENHRCNGFTALS